MSTPQSIGWGAYIEIPGLRLQQRIATAPLPLVANAATGDNAIITRLCDEDRQRIDRLTAALERAMPQVVT